MYTSPSTCFEPLFLRSSEAFVRDFTDECMRMAVANEMALSARRDYSVRDWQHEMACGEKLLNDRGYGSTLCGLIDAQNRLREPFKEEVYMDKPKDICADFPSSDRSSGVSHPLVRVPS